MMIRSFFRLFTAALLLWPLASAGLAAEPQWIWSHKEAVTKAEQGNCYFRKTFVVDGPASGYVEITADNNYELYVNSRSVGAGDNFQTRQKYDISPLLLPGRNVIAVRAGNSGVDPAGLAAKVVVKPKEKPPVELSTDASWKVTTKVSGNWARLEEDDARWPNAFALGEYGQTAPWGKPGAITEAKSAFVLNKSRQSERGFVQLRDGDRVVSLGSAFVERLQARNDLETLLTAGLPNANITYRNLGWSGDTVWGDARGVFGGRAEGFKRLVSDVALCNPTLLVICYGENEAFAGAAGLSDFRKGLGELLDTLEKTGARILLLGPRRHEDVGVPFPNPDQYNADLKQYSAVIAEAARERGHAFLDLFSLLPNENKLTSNGIHLTDYGYWRVSMELARLFGVTVTPWSLDLNTKENSYDATGLTITKIESKNSLLVSAMPRTLPLPLAPKGAANSQLPAIKVNGIAVQSTAFDQAQKQVEELRQLITEKNALYFNRYRPQNETYLFLFRKHEQGNNAVEIPQFEPLVADVERKIADLRRPKSVVIQLDIK